MGEIDEAEIAVTLREARDEVSKANKELSQLEIILGFERENVDPAEAQSKVTDARKNLQNVLNDLMSINDELNENPLERGGARARRNGSV